MTPILEGWKCPSCFLVHAPFVKSCDCMVVRARDPAGPLTMSEAISANQITEEWKKMDEWAKKREQWGGRDRPFDECRPVVTVEELVDSASAALDDVYKSMDEVKAGNQKLDSMKYTKVKF